MEDALPGGLGHLEAEVVLNDRARSHVADHEDRGIDHQTMGVCRDRVGHGLDCSYRMTAHGRYHHGVRTEDLGDHLSAPGASVSDYHVGTLEAVDQVCLGDSVAVEVDEGIACRCRSALLPGPTGSRLGGASLAEIVRAISFDPALVRMLSEERGTPGVVSLRYFPWLVPLPSRAQQPRVPGPEQLSEVRPSAEAAASSQHGFHRPSYPLLDQYQRLSSSRLRLGPLPAFSPQLDPCSPH